MILKTQQDISSALSKLSKLDRYGSWIFSHFEKYIHGNVLEVGAGIGNIVAHYLDRCESVVGTEIFDNKVTALKQRFPTEKFQAFNIDIFGQDYKNCFQDESFDSIVCVNVLEHIRDDEKALQIMHNLLKDQGILILYVPAFSALFSEMDHAVGHHRRYDRGELVDKAQRAGFSVLEKKYANLPGIVPYYIKGKLLRKKSSYSETISDKSMGFYNFMFQIVQKLEGKFPPPIGLSEIVIAQKKSRY